MAMIDYGTILVRDGVIVNKGKMFMDESDTGFKTELTDNYFAVAGDENLTMCFYKYNVAVYCEGRLICSLWLGYAGIDNDGKTMGTLRDEKFFDIGGSGCDIHVKAIDQNIYDVETCLDYDTYWVGDDDWREKKMPWLVLREALGLTEERRSDRAQKEYRKFAQRAKRKKLFVKGAPCGYYGSDKSPYISWPDKGVPSKFSVKWSYGGHEYEAITGYGVDSNEETFENLIASGRFGYTRSEIDYIRSIFEKDRVIRGRNF